MTDKELMQQALDALEKMKAHSYLRLDYAEEAITALRERLAQPEQEPKCGAIIEVFGKDWRLDYMSLPVGKHKLYTQQYNYTPPAQRTWVGLTDEERGQIINSNFGTGLWFMAKDIEAKLKEKNT